MPNTVTVTVANANTLISSGYTKIEMWITTDSGNTYQEVTSSVISPAKIVSNTAATQFQMGGRMLKYILNGGIEQTVNFNSINMYWTPTQVAGAINAVTPNLASVTANAVVLTSPIISVNGRANTINITYNDATDLGWTPGLLAIGTDARPTLVNGTFIYTYIDLAGAPTNQYKWRFSANGINPISSYSLPIFSASSPIGVPISIGTAYFIGLDGTPQKRTLTIVTDYSPFVVTSGGLNYSVGTDLPSTLVSDSNGFIQVPLIQGSRIRIGIEGTAYIRELVVPNTSSFDIITAMATALDPFTIQVPAPLLTRRIT